MDLLVNAEAEILHNQGLNAERVGDYETARSRFSLAQGIVTSPDLKLTADSLTQLAHITRDLGFTFVRQAAKESKLPLLDLADDVLKQSLDTTGALIVRAHYGGADEWLRRIHDVPVRPNNVTEVFTEHGETIGVLGRLATLKVVMSDKDLRNRGGLSKERLDIAQHYYLIAHRILRDGSNGYYRVSNAMNAARHDLLVGNTPRAKLWLGRAGVGLAWTALCDQENLKDASLTSGRRALDLRSYDAAKLSVLARP